MTSVNSVKYMKAALVCAIFVVAGCASSGNGGWQTEYSRAMSDARSSYDLHDYAKAKLQYHQAATINPTRAEPWLKLANLNFYQKNYGRAIVGAREALKRNPNLDDARSILTAAGLRVAIQSLDQLNGAELQGPAREEAKNLAAKMRSVLGEDVLGNRQTVSRNTYVKPQRAVPTPVKHTRPIKAKPKPRTNAFDFLPGT